jgi:hypothetical protein
MEGLPVWIVWRLPARIVYWAFIRCYAADGQAPGPEYERVAKWWEARYRLNDYQRFWIVRRRSRAGAQ